MSFGNAFVARIMRGFTEEALRANDGKVVPLKDKPGGEVIGTATLKYDANEKALRADFEVDDPKMAEALRGNPPHPYFG